MKYLKDKKHIHFIAIGGIGMSALALVLLKKGYKISGSDLKPNFLTRTLEGLGADIYAGHSRNNIKQSVDLVVRSSCIGNDNPEVLKAFSRNITVVFRGDILAELFEDKKGIAVCGCHGKTTTSAMIAAILTGAGLDPTVLVGGEVNFLGSNAKNGQGEYLIAEADESDGSFLKLKPMYSVVTNIDEDHMEYFKDTGRLIESFREYASNIKKGGCLIYLEDDSRSALIKGACRVESMSFGFKQTADVCAKNIASSGCQVFFDCYMGREKLGVFKICMPGLHNVLNALAAVCAALKIGLSAAQIKSGLEKFTGTRRRFQVKGCFDGVTVIEDYAHHPAEITATLKAVRSLNPKRVICVFQPHKFTRTFYLLDRFSGCFVLSDYLVLTDIYSAGEEAMEGVTGRALYEKVACSGHKKTVYMDKEKITEHLRRLKNPGDVIVVLGAGDINGIADELTERLK